jgi:hypothetical protein
MNKGAMFCGQTSILSSCGTTAELYVFYLKVRDFSAQKITHSSSTMTLKMSHPSLETPSGRDRLCAALVGSVSWSEINWEPQVGTEYVLHGVCLQSEQELFESLQDGWNELPVD